MFMIRKLELKFHIEGVVYSVHWGGASYRQEALDLGGRWSGGCLTGVRWPAAVDRGTHDLPSTEGPSKNILVFTGNWSDNFEGRTHGHTDREASKYRPLASSDEEWWVITEYAQPYTRPLASNSLIARAWILLHAWAIYSQYKLHDVALKQAHSSRNWVFWCTFMRLIYRLIFWHILTSWIFMLNTYSYDFINQTNYVLSNSESVQCNFFSKFAAAYRILRKSSDFSLRYRDISTSKWQPSAILELFYHRTRPPTKSLLLAAAACQISCQSDTQIWRLAIWFFAYLAWNAYSGQGLRELWTPKCDYLSSRSPKGTSCVNPRRLSYQL